MPLHLRKLSVGSNSLADLAHWQWGRVAQGHQLVHVTRHAPRRQKELLAGGSIYWIVKGRYSLRQSLIAIESAPADEDHPHGGWGLHLDSHLYAVSPWPHRPFQGWRYLLGEEAPPDLSSSPLRPENLDDYLAKALPHGLDDFMQDFGLAEPRPALFTKPSSLS